MIEIRKKLKTNKFTYKKTWR